jgi:hypothetical protein
VVRAPVSNDAKKRPPTPEPEASEATDTQELGLDAFSELSLVNQLRLIRPRLLQVIRDEYPPALWRVNPFYQTEGSRARASKSYLSGDLGEHQISEVVIPELERWALRGDRWINFRDVSACHFCPEHVLMGSPRLVWNHRGQ